MTLEQIIELIEAKIRPISEIRRIAQQQDDRATAAHERYATNDTRERLIETRLRLEALRRHEQDLEEIAGRLADLLLAPPDELDT